jgi:hypothetical protein
MAAESLVPKEKEKTSRVTTGFRKLFPGSTTSVAAQRPPSLGSLADFEEFPPGRSVRKDAEAAYSIIVGVLKHLCNECKCRSTVFYCWEAFEGNSYKQTYGCRLCNNGLKLNFTCTEDHVVYRYIHSDTTRHKIATQRAIYLRLENRALWLHIHKLPELHAHIHVALYDMEKANIQLAIQWFAFCRQHHTSQCGMKEKHTIPGMKVIDCISGEICAITPGQPYVVLSYVWGPSSTPSSPIPGQLTEKFPRTIHDAIWVAREFEIPYLWVDRYCIDQNNQQEKHVMVSSMDKIYTGAELTIIAAAGADPHYGLPGVSSTKRHVTSMTALNRSSLVGCLRADHEIMNSIWSTRAWTYQEMLLSRRRLVFTDSQMIFECCFQSYQEALSITLSSYPTLSTDDWWDAELLDNLCLGNVGRAIGTQYAFPRNGIGDIPKLIYDRIEEYTLRNLSYPGDILNALDGIFGAFSRSMESFKNHFWGIPIFGILEDDSRAWTKSFLRGLAWLVKIPAERRPGLWPSWSWAIVMGGSVNFALRHNAILSQDLPSVTMMHRKGANQSISNYVEGQRNHAEYHPWMDITTWVLEGCRVESGRFENDLPINPALTHPIFNHVDVLVILDVDISKELPASDLSAVFLFASSRHICFLITQKTQDDSLRRIGIGYINLSKAGEYITLQKRNVTWLPGLEPGDSSNSWKMKTVRLV